MATEDQTSNFSTAPDGIPLSPEDFKKLDVEALVTRCRQGDQRAWAELNRRFEPLVRAVARSFRLHPADCEDVCQSTWIRIIEGISFVRTPDKLRAWIVTVARREALRHRTRSERHVPVGGGHDLHDIADTGVTPEERAVERAEAALVRAAVERLDPGHRALLLLLFSDTSPSYTEISARLGIPRGSIGPTRKRALEQLKALLEAEWQVNSSGDGAFLYP
ncbi:sigma-70 family RNA polymerase sigma factor [Streptomyces sp. NPDC086554]|uniref:RNA polymerase sigma factor n=1 Tax=Streptomyces sp. NPDC086554 TaxID=3154864 RepID=UPI0034460E19